ncbi:MAG TPA: FAD/NAD(P)-binding protein, partial [Anaerolineales bacterium]|nr:FAD/NAD(P)-binding protein [Anaerolineales bacterium]
MSRDSYHVAVIGAGASGTLAAAQLNRLAPPHAKLAIIGSQSQPARGVAYETSFQTNLLNVPAGNMSAFPGDMDHFV